MTAQDYIQNKLKALRLPLEIAKPQNDEQLVEAIFRAVMSKKFRKYAASEELTGHIRNAIRMNVEKREPINITFLHGAYKLWRLEESPEVDWAELFSLMYYTNWVKPIYEIYEPGVWFDFFVDDLIVPKLDNVGLSDIQAYIDSYQNLIDFLKQYQPANLKMTITTVGSRFESSQAFDDALATSLEKLKADSSNKLPELTDAQRAMVELNTKTTPEQLADPEWREKVYVLHNAYSPVKGGTGYHKNRPEKILAFTQGLPAAICVGSTKDSIMKFWVGAGVLKPLDGSYRQIVMSPSQLEKTQFNFEDISIQNLSGKNFSRIRTIS